jgi:hypothetical protein
MITKANAILSLRPGAEWVLRGDKIQWLDQNQTEPTAEEIVAEIARLEDDYPRRIVQQSRAAAYTQESDPLFFKVQRGEATLEEWNQKIEEIRQRFPYPNP